jgi:hypothetical protein
MLSYKLEQSINFKCGEGNGRLSKKDAWSEETIAIT